MPWSKLDKGLFEEYAPKEKFDLILALHVLEHVDNSARILGQIRKWLNDGGQLVVLVPNRNFAPAICVGNGFNIKP